MPESRIPALPIVSWEMLEVEESSRLREGGVGRNVQYLHLYTVRTLCEPVLPTARLTA